MLPSWYVIPTKEDRNAGGDNSERWMGMTPHAPWTKNWIIKPDAERLRSVVGRIQAGMRQPEIKAAQTIVRRRPNHCEVYPKTVPPTQAPVFMRMEARVEPAALRCLDCFMNVV